MAKKRVKVKGSRISYYDNCCRNPEKTLVFLQPGDLLGNSIEDFLRERNLKFRILSPDYPGRGESDCTEDNSIPALAERILAWKRALKLKRPVLIGVSFGAAVANEIIARGKRCDFEKAFIVLGGEYFRPVGKAAINFFFYPCRFSETLRKIYRFLVVSTIPALSGLYSVDLRSINEQWLSIVNYKLPLPGKEVSLPVVLINSKNDRVIDPSSKGKLRVLYKGCREYSIKAPHDLKLLNVSEIAREALPVIEREISN
ncbi:MAG: alpha/beta hydrolase [archaeon]